MLTVYREIATLNRHSYTVKDIEQKASRISIDFIKHIKDTQIIADSVLLNKQQPKLSPNSCIRFRLASRLHIVNYGHVEAIKNHFTESYRELRAFTKKQQQQKRISRYIHGRLSDLMNRCQLPGRKNIDSSGGRNIPDHYKARKKWLFLGTLIAIPVEYANEFHLQNIDRVTMIICCRHACAFLSHLLANVFHSG